MDGKQLLKQKVIKETVVCQNNFVKKTIIDIFMPGVEMCQLLSSVQIVNGTISTMPSAIFTQVLYQIISVPLESNGTTKWNI